MVKHAGLGWNIDARPAPMGDKSGIEWTDATWNPTTGCDQVSPGCDHCYALTLAARLKKMGQARYQKDGNPKTSGPGFGLTLHHDQLDLPLRWKKPRMIFVNSMSDLFHDDVPDIFISDVFVRMALATQHTFQVLTKRPRRMAHLLSSGSFVDSMNRLLETTNRSFTYRWPLENVWLGTSVEDQKRADLRIPLLLETPAAVRFLSVEPLLGRVEFNRCPAWNPGLNDFYLEGINWVIVGGESGPQARPMHPDWARLIRDESVKAGVPFFFKQWGEWVPGFIEQAEEFVGGKAFRYEPGASGGETTQSSRVHDFGEGVGAYRKGKKTAGRELDGRTWDEMPERQVGWLS